MKYVSFVMMLVFFSTNIFSQNVGINNNDPHVSMDVSGAIAHRKVTIIPYQNAVNVPANISFLEIGNDGIPGDKSIVDPETWVDGRRLVILNSTPFNVIFSGVTIPPYAAFEFICSAPSGGWKVLKNSGNTTTNSWSTLGNMDTDPNVNYLGTSDNTDLVFKTNNEEKMRLLGNQHHNELQLKGGIEDSINLVFSQKNNVTNDYVDYEISQRVWPDGDYGLNISSHSNLSYFEHRNMLHLSSLTGYMGMGVNQPIGKLTIGGHRSLGSINPTLMLIDSSLTNENGSSIQFRNHIGAQNYQITSHFGNQSTGDDSYLTFSRNGLYQMRLRGNGNLGIGVINPTSKLDVNGKISISDDNSLELGKGIIKETNAGTISYQKFSDALDIVGAGELATLTDRKVRIWSEGGTTVEGKLDVNGDINTTGKVKVNGNAGTIGQVLVSNGPSTSPSWQTVPGASMQAIAFGSINGDTGAIMSGSGNFTALKYTGSGSAGIYGIIVNGEDYSLNTHAVVGTVNDISGPVFLQFAENDYVAPMGFMVHTKRFVGGDFEQYDADFSFVVYKQQ